MWLCRGGRDGPPIVCYECQRLRDGDLVEAIPIWFRSGDVALWARLRRADAAKVLPKREARRPESYGEKWRSGVDRLFEIERTISDASAEDRASSRLAPSKPIVDQFKRALGSASSKAAPKAGALAHRRSPGAIQQRGDSVDKAVCDRRAAGCLRTPHEARRIRATIYRGPLDGETERP